MTGAAFIGGIFLKQGFWTIVGGAGKGIGFVGNILGLTPQASKQLKDDLAFAPEVAKVFFDSTPLCHPPFVIFC